LATEVRKHDLIHSVLRLDYLIPALRHRVPKVLNFHNQIDPGQIEFLRRHARGPTVFTPVGVKMMKGLPRFGVWRPIHNAIPVARYAYAPEPVTPNYLAFLGRVTPIKGAHIAIRVARTAGLRLVLAGNIGTAPGDSDYFEREVRPNIDGDQIQYVGELDDFAKGNVLRGAVALLHPIQWDDPCPLVPIESLSCGTPVIAFARGELPNLINHGVTGVLCADEAAMIRAVWEVGMVSRRACRREAEARFDVARMVDQYEEVYRWLLNGRSEVPLHWEQP
jgi:glycosyltransferase involved in cell wall biosynthesis